MGVPIFGVPHGTTHGCFKFLCNFARSPMGVSFPVNHTHGTTHALNSGTPTRSLTGDPDFKDTHGTTHGELKFFGHSHEMPRGGGKEEERGEMREERG